MEKIVKDIEENLYALIGQIDYGEISNIDTFWGSLSDALLKLKLENWDSGSLGSDPAVSDILASLGSVFPELADENLIELTSEMEEKSHASSQESLDEEDLKYLQSNSIDFETLFTKFLDKLPELNGH